MTVLMLTTALSQAAGDQGEGCDDVVEVLTTMKGVFDCLHVELCIVGGKTGLGGNVFGVVLAI